MNKKFSLLLAFLFVTMNNITAQVNYFDYRSQKETSCSGNDDISVLNTKKLLDSLYSIGIAEGKEQFYYDYSMVYFLSYFKWKDENDLESFLTFSHKCWEEFENVNALWNLMLVYSQIERCEDYKLHLDLYMKVMDTRKRRKLIDHDQIAESNKKCM
jgi:hypothetical protein